MNTIDLTRLYRNSVGFDRFAALVDSALRTDSASSGYPPYNIEVLGENRYAVTLAVAGFGDDELDINVENGVLSVRGEKAKSQNRSFLHQGIASRSFERKFNLADHVEVKAAQLHNGILTIDLVRILPEAMKPRRIEIDNGNNTLDHESRDAKAGSDEAA